MMRVKLFTRYVGKVDYILSQPRFSLKVRYIYLYGTGLAPPQQEKYNATLKN